MSFTANDYALSVAEDVGRIDIGRLAEWMYSRALRETFDAPGFALIQFLPSLASADLRRIMVGLKRTMSSLHRGRLGRELCYRSMGRFNQQTTTKFHLDGAPEQSFLMLGYEPSDVDSELAMADYSRAAFDLSLTPAEFLERHNPMFPAQEMKLTGYITRLTAFDRRRPQIVCINNSRQPFVPQAGHQLGVFHQATIVQPRSDAARIVNSTMIGICPDLTGETFSPESQLEFQQTDRVSGSLYN